MDKSVTVAVDAARWTGVLPHHWNYIGYDECNYTHSPGGIELIRKFGNLEKPYYREPLKTSVFGGFLTRWRKLHLCNLLYNKELAIFSKEPLETQPGFPEVPYIRTHHLLCTGNCHGTYKWGSTNVYVEDEKGSPVYDYGVIDRMCDIWLSSNCKPFFEIGFMPMDLADTGGLEGKSWVHYNEYKRIGWNRPPKDYDKWYGLIRALIQHLLDRYGQKELESWYFEMWNEPDISYWSGTHGEFCKLYDYTEAAIHDVCGSLRFGGPATCGALSRDGKAANFLRDFLEHTRRGKNFRTGKTGTRLDFTSFHAKGGGYSFTTRKGPADPPSVQKLLDQVRIGGTIIKEGGYGDLECILSEADPDGWAAGGRFDNPVFDFRNTEYYASYVASVYKNIHDLAAELKMDIRPLAWAFMFEGERCFEGTRTFSTQGIDKAVMNVFKLFAKLGSQLVELNSSGAGGPEKHRAAGPGAEIDGWAVMTGTKSLEAFIYCHEDTWDTEGYYPVEFTVNNLPFKGPCRITHYRIDKDHSNAYGEWVRQGRPDYPAEGQYRAIKARDGLELAEPVRTLVSLDGAVGLSFDMPVKSVSLIIIDCPYDR